MTLIYVEPRKIDQYILELKRVARNRVILVEFHSTSFFNRLALRWNSGYNAYNYKLLLKKNGFYDVMMMKIPEESWPGGDPQKTFAYIIVATPPLR